MELTWAPDLVLPPCSVSSSGPPSLLLPQETRLLTSSHLGRLEDTGPFSLIPRTPQGTMAWTILCECLVLHQSPVARNWSSVTSQMRPLCSRPQLGAGRWDRREGGSFYSKHVIAGAFSEGQANGQHPLEAEVVAERAEVSPRFVVHTDVCGTHHPSTPKTSATLPNNEPCSWLVFVQMIWMEFASRQPRRQYHA